MRIQRAWQSQKSRQKGGEVRITSGEYRGRRIFTPGGATHPMGKREKLALFNMISENVLGARVLDAYAGSGALGIETLSRGARFCVFIDDNAAAAGVIRENLKALGITTGRVVKSSVSSFTPDEKFDLIIADPPYDGFKIDEIEYLGGFLTDDGILVLSHPDEIIEIKGLKLAKTRQYARAHISIFTKLS